MDTIRFYIGVEAYSEWYWALSEHDLRHIDVTPPTGMDEVFEKNVMYTLESDSDSMYDILFVMGDTNKPKFVISEELELCFRGPTKNEQALLIT